MTNIEESRCHICGRSVPDGRELCRSCNQALGLLGRSDENLRNALAYVQARMEVRPVGRPRLIRHRQRVLQEGEVERNVRLAYVLCRFNATEVARRFGLGVPQVQDMVAPVEAARALFVDLFG